MTPQLLQAIKLLQLSSHELSSFVEAELERNPLLERAEEGEAPYEAAPTAPMDLPVEGDWASTTIETDAARLDDNLGTGIDNAFETDRAPVSAERNDAPEGSGLSAQSWNGTPGSGDGEAANLEAYVAATVSLGDHLAAQLAVAVNNPVDRMIGQMLIDGVDEAGYLTEPLQTIAERLGVNLRRVERILAIIHTFEPAGIAARNLAECLALQLKELDRYDPAMQALVAHLPMVAARDFAGLRRVCGVDQEDMAEMISELRRLDPKPGRRFSGGNIQAVIADVTVRAANDGSWLVELNSDALPRLLVNQTYAARVTKGKSSEEDRSFVANCLQTANWLTKSLEQRAKTILKVSSEIVRQQDAFFAHGVEHLRPLNLKVIADAISMHESTVSRVTSNKYMATPRGLFELKYFFTASISAHGGGEAHSAESVRFKIRQMIEAESPKAVLSDDAIVLKLKEMKIDIARRTVAKYRESLRLPSSAERRREKQAMGSQR